MRALMLEAPGADPADVRRVLERAGRRFRRPDGSYRFENRFRFVIATA